MPRALQHVLDQFNDPEGLNEDLRRRVSFTVVKGSILADVAQLVRPKAFQVVAVGLSMAVRTSKEVIIDVSFLRSCSLSKTVVLRELPRNLDGS